MSIISPQWALLLGIGLAIIFPINEKIQKNAKLLSSKILQISVVLLGAALNFHSVIDQGAKGALITFLSILFVFILGFFAQRLFKINTIQSVLITAGTAICGGSAIGALAPILRADTLAMTVSMAIVFLLNALSVFIFPILGKMLSLSQEQFGTWSALAVHDTSSVVAVSSIYGQKALEVATMLKLTRALWIIPMSLMASMVVGQKEKGKISIPWFILGFLSLSLVFTFFSIPADLKALITSLSKLGFATTLFLIGLTLNLQQIRLVGFKPLSFGVSLWVLVSFVSLVIIYNSGQ